MDGWMDGQRISPFYVQQRLSFLSLMEIPSLIAAAQAFCHHVVNKLLDFLQISGKRKKEKKRGLRRQAGLWWTETASFSPLYVSVLGDDWKSLIRAGLRGAAEEAFETHVIFTLSLNYHFCQTDQCHLSSSNNSSMCVMSYQHCFKINEKQERFRWRIQLTCSRFFY